jgi:hypothetical protein
VQDRPVNSLISADFRASGCSPSPRLGHESVDLLLQRVRALELLAGPELDRGQSERQAISRYCEAGMHQNATCGVESRLAVSIGTVKIDTSLSHRVHVFPLVGKLRGIVHHQDRTSGC